VANMMMLLVPAGIFMFRNKISAILGPYIPAISPQKISYLGHLITLSTACIYVLPLEFVGLGAFKKTAYMVSMWSATCTMMLNIKANYPLPDMPDTAGLSLTNMAAMKAWMTTTLESAVKPWLQKAMMGVDFHFLFFSLIFLTASPSIAPLAILARRSLWTVCSYCSKNSPDGFVWSKFAPIWEAKLKPKEKEVQLYSALAEIVLGIYLAVSVFLPSRQLIATILYWNYLTMRFRLPRSREYHLQAWSQLGQRIDPLLKMAPFLNKPLDMAKTYFNGQ